MSRAEGHSPDVLVPLGRAREPVSKRPGTFHAVVDEHHQQYVVYHPRTMSLFEVPRAAAEAVQAWERAQVQDEALSTEHQTFVRGVLRRLEAMVSEKAAAEEEKEISRRRLRRLAINVTQVCNLHCPMCYAANDNGVSGTYGSEVKFVVPGVPEQAFERMLEHYPQGVDRLQFHGGEPLLHPRGIVRACEGVLALCAEKDVQPPMFTVITNGTQMSEKVLDIIERYSIAVTVSLDGTRELNDANRPWAPGRSAYDAAIRGMAELKERKLPFSIECTVSKPHLGVDLCGLASHLQNLGAVGIHVAPASVARNHPHSLNPEEQEQMLGQWRELFDLVMDRYGTSEPLHLLSVISTAKSVGNKQREKHICPAGNHTIAVDVTGNISACFMFTGMRQFQLGQAQERSQHKEYRERQAKLMDTLLARPTLCSTCWADGACAECAAGQYISGMRREKAFPYSCRYDQLLIERVVLGLARLRRNPRTWAQFKTNLVNAPEDDE